jgi:hypothetical protein
MKMGPELLQWLNEDEVSGLARMAYRDALKLCTPPKGEPFRDAETGDFWASTADWSSALVSCFEARVRLLHAENFGGQPETGSSWDIPKLMELADANGWDL